MANKKLSLKEVLDVTFYDISTSKPIVHFDSLKVSTLDTKSAQTKIRGGKGNAVLAAFDGEKEAQLMMSDALLSTRGLELITGKKTSTGTARIYMRQTTQWELVNGKMQDKGGLYPLTANSAGEIDLAFTPVEAASEILVYSYDDDCGTTLGVPTLSTKKLTNIAFANKKVIVYYSYNVSTSDSYTITSADFPGTYRVVGSTLSYNVNTGRNEAMQFLIPAGKVSSQFKLDMKADSGEPSPIDFTVEVLRDPNSTTMVVMTQYDTNNAV